MSATDGDAMALFCEVGERVGAGIADENQADRALAFLTVWFRGLMADLGSGRHVDARFFLLDDRAVFRWMRPCLPN